MKLRQMNSMSFSSIRTDKRTETIMSQEIEEKLIEFICRNFMVERDEFELDQSLIDQGVIDSFGLIEISSYLQKEFGFQIQETEMNRANFGSIKKIVDFVGRKLAP